MTRAWQFGVIRGESDASRIPTPILKIGGSLLVQPDWPAFLNELVSVLDQPLIIVGGGAVVDGLRAIDAASPQPSWLMDDLAIDAMSLTARIVAHALDLVITDSPHARSLAVLDVAAWLTTAPAPPNLPATWDVTSDSIAAAVADASSRGLILAKSTPPPRDAMALQDLATSGWVDAWFPKAAARLATIAWAAPQ